MVGRREMQIVNALVKEIRDKGDIHVWDLIDQARVGKHSISIRDYNMVKGYMEHKFDASILYDKKTKMWTVINPIPKIRMEKPLENFNE